MAGPQFFVPPRVRPSSRSKQRFTLVQANRALPLVSRIVADVVRVHKEASQLQGKYEKLGKASQNRKPMESAIERSLERLSELLDELDNIGCDCKDFQVGLVDFIGRHKGRDVCLCWKLGEGEIGFWHELDAGFSGRQPVSKLEETPDKLGVEQPE